MIGVRCELDSKSAHRVTTNLFKRRLLCENINPLHPNGSVRAHSAPIAAMNFPTPPVRPPSIRRRVGKLAWFLVKGHRPSLAWHLARTDAVKNQDYRDISRAALESAVLADPTWTDLAAADGLIRSRTLNLEFVRDDLANRGYRTWLAMARLGWRFERSPSGALLARRDPIALQISTDEECDMIREIFLMGCYDLRLPGEWHVVDIGGNVGMAALFFAQQAWCRSVTSYEPFGPTADGFDANLALNPTLAAKITLVRKGLGEANSVLTAHYDRELRGSMSVSGVGAWRGATAASATPVSITVAAASIALEPVFSALGSCRLFAKIDCEGSEYAIFRDLEAKDLISKFSAFAIEWHGRGPDEIVGILLRHGFVVHVSPLSPDQRSLGLIYAMR